MINIHNLSYFKAGRVGERVQVWTNMPYLSIIIQARSILYIADLSAEENLLISITGEGR